MIRAILIFVLIVFGRSLSAQVFVHPLTPVNKLNISNTDSVKIFAVMVEFKKDNDDKTFGDGTFGSLYSKDYGDSIIDPLPHDKLYFENHLEFAANYFRNVSGGKVGIDYYVLPDIITLPENMRYYSPPINSDDYSNLAKFAQEVWKRAGKTASIDFSKFNMFVIFHAGAGRDISLPGSLGLERDLPSVFLNLRSLKKILGNNFNGFTAGNAVIKNTAILPETESREMETVLGKSLIQLSINGLLAAQIASYMGLPDLFNTKTGNSAIGRMGLMDGQSIFAYSGLFPPEPSAWEKIRLGWESPKIISTDRSLTISTRITAQPFSDNTIFEIPINSHEYFLIENRQRDALKNGAVITYKIGSKEFKKHFEKDKQGFRSYNVDSLKGVITNVDEFDWALPGSGILIWHVDKNIIDSNLVSNTINANENRKGIFVEEADGIRDIGVKFKNIFGDVIVGEGEQADFWYASNNSKYYQNKFTPYTTPNTNANDGAGSFISLTDFSDNSNLMSFDVSFTNDSYRRYSNFKLTLPFKTPPVKVRYLSTCATRDSAYLIIMDNFNNLSVYNLKGRSVFTYFNFSEKKTALFSDNSRILIAGVNGKVFQIFESENQGAHWTTFSIAINDSITTLPVIIDYSNTDSLKMLVGEASGKIAKINFSFSSKELSLISEEKKFNDKIRFIAADKNYYSIATVNRLSDSDGNIFTLNSDQKIKQLILTEENKRFYNILLLENGNIIVVKNGAKYAERDDQASSVIVGDFKQDGQNYIAEATMNKIKVVSLSGAVIENYPFENFFNTSFSPYLLAFAKSESNSSNILAVDSVGRALMLNSLTGKMELPFPISLGNKLSVYPAAFKFLNSLNIVFIDSENRVTVIEKPKAEKYYLYWSQADANANNTNFIGEAKSSVPGKKFFPVNQAYNWPNPVYNDVTYFHFFVGEQSNVTIKIFDLSGKLVTTISKDAPGNMESEIQWDVSKIQSGVYFAYLSVKGAGGESANKIIKVVVVH